MNDCIIYDYNDYSPVACPMLHLRSGNFRIRSTVTGSGTGEGSGHRKHPDLVSLCGCVPEGIPED